MSGVSPHENILRVSTTNGGPVCLRIDAGAPVTIQLVIENTCSCGAIPRPGAYTDTDFGTR